MKRRNALTSVAVLIAAAACLGPAARAADISMNADDGIGTSSFNSGLHWVGGAAPAAGNSYMGYPLGSTYHDW
jgi:hypothetical protein